MSYLSSLRLHFAGRFQANVSTVNNDPAHFHNAAFLPKYQEMQGATPNGWFNPQGDAVWRLLGCKVTTAWLPTGPVTYGDPVLEYLIADSDTKPPAKLVDLDSEQQLVSEIWGLQVRIANTQGETLFTGDFEPAAFMDIWDRAASSSGGDQTAGAMYQSVLTNLKWGDVSASPFLVALKEAAGDGLLSIKFNVDGFNMDFTSPEFMTGRIVGTIGPASASEPRHLVLGRQFMASANPNGNFFTPQGQINFFAAQVDAANSVLYLDLGNALSTQTPGGMLNNVGDLTLWVYEAADGSSGKTVAQIGKIAAGGAGGYASNRSWYLNTAGIVAMPIEPNLLPLVQGSALVLTGNAQVKISEWPSGAFVRADTYVYRMSPGDRADIVVYATRFGAPLREARISFTFDESQLQGQVGEPGHGAPYVAPSPPVASAPDAIHYDTTALTDEHGRAVMTVTASDPGTPRYFNGDYGIDGQVYGLRPSFEDTATFGSAPTNQWNFVSFLVWSGFRTKVDGAPTWHDDLQPIFQQYANLYPVMNRFLNLADYASVVKNARLLTLAFGLPSADPNVMPVTRDLSPAKRAAILTWLASSPPPLGEPPERSEATTAATPSQAPKRTTHRADLTPPPPPPMQGGKAAAVARRVVVQRAKGGLR
jgi:hypothetical protein